MFGRFFLHSCVACSLLVVGLVTASPAEEVQAPDLEQLAERGRKFLEQAETRSLRWTCEFPLNEKVTVVMDIVQLHDRRRIELASIMDGKTVKEVIVIERDGYWYVEDALGNRKWVAFEAIMAEPLFYHFLARSDLMAYIDSSYPIGDFERYEGDTAIYRAPLAPEIRDEYEPLYEQMLQLLAVANEPNPALEKKANDFADLLNNGSEVRINTKTGVFEKSGAMQQEVYTKNVRWLTRAVPNLTDVDKVGYEDHTASIWDGAEMLEDVIIASNAPMWRPGDKSRERQECIVNVRTGAFCRVPYSLGQVVSATFSPDRDHVYLTGSIPSLGTIGVFEIDLNTHEHRRLGSQELLEGISLFPKVSPDGSMLSVQRQDLTAGILQSRIHLIDIDSGLSRPVGGAQDCLISQWMPDSKGWLGVVRTNQGWNNTRLSEVALFDMEGNVKKVCEGAQPVLLAEQGRILFEAPDDLWYTCDLEGKDRKKFHDGFPRFGFAAASSDGALLMMMKFQDGVAPKPCMIDAESGKIAELDFGPGLWTTPHW
ncbi:hypothetical protein [Bremerella cremea]|uniref:TolB family protein n=1 Tax=Bremerella cremea TaxID=1031537 RepID=UPI0031F05DBF